MGVGGLPIDGVADGAEHGDTHQQGQAGKQPGQAPIARGLFASLLRRCFAFRSNTPLSLRNASTLRPHRPSEASTSPSAVRKEPR